MILLPIIIMGWKAFIWRWWRPRVRRGLMPIVTLRWRHNERDSVSNHQPHDCLLNRLFRRRSKKTSKLRATALCAGNSQGTCEFPAQRASNAENVSIWWRHHEWGNDQEFCMLMYLGHLQNWLDYDHGLLIFLLLAPFRLSETGHIWGFRAFPGERPEAIETHG